MKFLIDAQLPPALKFVFHRNGFEAIHTLDLPQQNDTSDDVIREISGSEGYILITKDKDFYDSFVLKRQPPKLVMVRVGNMRTKLLMTFFEDRLIQIIRLLKANDLVILSQKGLTDFE